jgi:hypothetical protein
MISIEEAKKMFEKPTIEAIPTGEKRIVIPAYGFAGATDQKRLAWGADGSSHLEDVKGLVFVNPKDTCNQVLKQKDGVLLCFDAPGRKEKIQDYIDKNPDTFKTSIGLNKFIKHLKENIVNDGGKADLYDADTDFAAGLIGAPAKENIKVGQIFSGAKKKETLQAVFVKPGEVFEGTEGTPQTADKNGAYIIKGKDGIRMIQAAEFKKAYAITKMPQTNIKAKGLELG